MKLTLAQLLEMQANDEDTDIWLLNEDGSTSIVPDQDIASFQNVRTWPKYICRSLAVSQHIRSDGEDAALEYINSVIELTMLKSNSRKRATLATSLLAALKPR